MFDPVTAGLLRSAPGLPGLDPDQIPQLLTRHYAALVSARLRGATDATATDSEEWSLARIADTYELITSITVDTGVRRASAFVAATAHQILSRQSHDDANPPAQPVHRDGVDPAIAAAILFLAAEQYADANEAANEIDIPESGVLYEARILAEHVRDLARGNLTGILDRADRWRRDERPRFSIQRRALAVLLDALVTGVELLAGEAMSVALPDAIAGRFENSRSAFKRVLELSSSSAKTYATELGGELFTTYAGPRHLASLLLAAHDGIYEAFLTQLPPPTGADPAFWGKWLSFRAAKFPFIWPNHREAIAKGFHETGMSAVMVLPTGAGKTTVSSLKIAGALARGKKVIFLAPTHALVEQLTDDLQEMFPEDILGSIVSSEFDFLLLADTQFQTIEVMTPERCLAMLSFAPEAFSEVGLMVFDECHLLSPESGKIRRALDGMLCLLAFHKIAPEADTLFLSAMLKNGEEFSGWIADLTGRQCIFVDLLWKPSRQARGVVIYRAAELLKIKKSAMTVQTALDASAGKQAVALRSAAKRELLAQPHAIWGLQHNWLFKKIAHCSFTSISDQTILVAGDIKYGFRFTPNANHVSAKLAATAAKSGLKTIVFVNSKADAVSVANDVSGQLAETVTPTKTERDRWDALEAELGDLKHSLLDGPSVAVPHNSAMLRLERDLAERMFRRPDGAKVIVATPTLAQGLNLPAQLAILAGDKRAKTEGGGREELEAHEILNAAARAGRAGHLANGVVLLVPEPIISFPESETLDNEVVKKLHSILPDDDRCVSISDPLEVVLDRLTQGQLIDRDVVYTINRMSALQADADGKEGASLFDLKRSLGAFVAAKQAKSAEFAAKLDTLKTALKANDGDDLSPATAILASQSGLPTDVLQRLRARIELQIGLLPNTVVGWVHWTLEWLAADEEALALLMFEVGSAALGAIGSKKSAKLTADVLMALRPGIDAWLTGKPFREIEIALGGHPDSELVTQMVCPRARALVGSVIPRGLAFIISVVSHVVEDIGPFETQADLDPDVVASLSAALRRGLDLPEKLSFAMANKGILSRVLIHAAWAKTTPEAVFSQIADFD